MFGLEPLPRQLVGHRQKVFSVSFCFVSVLNGIVLYLIQMLIAFFFLAKLLNIGLIDFFENIIIELQKYVSFLVIIHIIFYFFETYILIICYYRKHYNGIFPLVDIPFILHVVHLLLIQVDNTIVHMRTLAFVFTNFGFLTQRPELLDMLCNKILLHPYIFERFIIHWNSGVRIFYLQCLFWRIRPLWSFSTVQWGFKDVLKSACDGSKCWNAWNEEQHEDGGKHKYYIQIIK